MQDATSVAGLSSFACLFAWFVIKQVPAFLAFQRSHALALSWQCAALYEIAQRVGAAVPPFAPPPAPPTVPAPFPSTPPGEPSMFRLPRILPAVLLLALPGLAACSAMDAGTTVVKRTICKGADIGADILRSGSRIVCGEKDPAPIPADAHGSMTPTPAPAPEPVASNTAAADVCTDPEKCGVPAADEIGDGGAYVPAAARKGVPLAPRASKRLAAR